MLIEHAIKSYHARQLSELEASGLISATERALVERLEKRFDQMKKETVNRIGDLIGGLSYDASYSLLMLEELHRKFSGDQFRNADLDPLRSDASRRMQHRYEKHGAEQVASLERQLDEVRQEFADHQEKAKQLAGHYKELDQKYKELQGKYESRGTQIQQLRERVDTATQEARAASWEKDSVLAWTRGLMNYVRQNVGRMKTGEQGLQEYIEKNPQPKGL